MSTIKYQKNPGQLKVYSSQVLYKPDMHNGPDEN